MTSRASRTITWVMDENELTDRLRALGDDPVADHVRDGHLRRMTAAVPQASPKRFGRLAVAAAAIAGFLAGSTGLAMAGALPEPAQDVAHDVLSVVRVEVPAGKEGKRGPCVSDLAKRTELTEAEKQTEKAKCPKGPFGPPTGVGPDGAPGRGGSDPHANDPCRGRPPWAGQPGLDPAEKQRMKDEVATTCGREAEPPEIEAPEQDDQGG